MQPRDGEEPEYNPSQISISELETELELTRKRMQDVVEEYESSQEEMRAANEELQSANEELRSTMEELATSKEELQSMNEELSTVNQENRHKVEELSQLSSDLQNPLTATDIATLFLDRQFRILRFTPRLTELINLRETGKGRPLADFTHRLGHSDLIGDAKKVLDRLHSIEREIQSEQGSWYLLRLSPYRSAEDRIEGVVITLVDISEFKKANEDLSRREEELSHLTANLESRVRSATDEVRNLASKLALAEQVERSRISQVLHDDLQQRIHSAHMRMHLLCQDLNIPEDKYHELSNELNSAIQLARDLSIDLSPPVLNSEGLKESLQWLRHQVKRLHDLDVTLKITGPYNIKDKDLRLLLFQVARELLFNVVKHAQTKEATLELSSVGDELRMMISDQGCGFETQELRDSEEYSGFGLGSMHERLDLLGGTCNITSVPNEGTKVTISLPLSSTPRIADQTFKI